MWDEDLQVVHRPLLLLRSVQWALATVVGTTIKCYNSLLFQVFFCVPLTAHIVEQWAAVSEWIVGIFVVCAAPPHPQHAYRESPDSWKKAAWKKFGRNKFKWSILYANQKDLRFFFRCRLYIYMVKVGKWMGEREPGSKAREKNGKANEEREMGGERAVKKFVDLFIKGRPNGLIY